MRNVLFYFCLIGFVFSLFLAPSARAHPESNCPIPTFNREEPSGIDIVIDNTLVQVLRADPNRCYATIFNVGAEEIRCSSTANALTATANGMIVPSGSTLEISRAHSVVRAWQCTRTGATNSTVNIVESRGA